jgi:UDP-N-acetylglucosamine:LPS N-acetylglucosamine transferase
MQTKKLDFVFFDAGGGHRAAATALKAVIEQQKLPWEVRLVNFQDVLDNLDIFRKLFGIRMQDVYNWILKKGWTLGSPQGVVVMHWLIRRYHRDQVRGLIEFWKKSQPDIVVSLIPNFARALHESLRAVQPRTPLVTILTDLADYPPHFWMEPNQDQYWICGTDKAVEQAKALGYSADRIIRVSGMILNPRFYAPVEVDRHAERRRLGLHPERPTGLILFGGQGSGVIETILQRLESAGSTAQFIAICGKNESLKKRLQSRRWKMPVVVEGFTSEIPYYMRLSDFLIGKPGPGSISEAMAMKVPVIVERNAWTLPQERYNADWVRESDTGIVLANFNQIAPAVQRMTEGGELERMRNNTARLNNRAVYEIPPILEQLLK